MRKLNVQRMRRYLYNAVPDRKEWRFYSDDHMAIDKVQQELEKWREIMREKHGPDGRMDLYNDPMLAFNPAMSALVAIARPGR